MVEKKLKLKCGCSDCNELVRLTAFNSLSIEQKFLFNKTVGQAENKGRSEGILLGFIIGIVLASMFIIVSFL